MTLLLAIFGHGVVDFEAISAWNTFGECKLVTDWLSHAMLGLPYVLLEVSHTAPTCPASRTIIVDVRITCRPINDCGCIVLFSCALQCYCILYCILCSCNKTSVVYDAANGECNGKCSLHDIELVEKVQRRFTKRLRGLR